MTPESKDPSKGYVYPRWYRKNNLKKMVEERLANSPELEPTKDIAIETRNLSAFYDDTPAYENVSLQFGTNRVTSIIGGSGCGKTTLLHSLDLMTRLNPKARVEGEILFNGQNINQPQVDPIPIRRQIGIVIQRSTPFPKSIYENIAWGARIHGYKGNMDELVEDSLQQAALWNEVKDRLKDGALKLSGGQRQRLCIARAIALQPTILLMDEPCAALDPISTQKIEDLIRELKKSFTVILTTHNMEQAGRISDTAIVMHGQPGRVIEQGGVGQIFVKPKRKETNNLVTGRS